jgi:hypothetical protein
MMHLEVAHLADHSMRSLSSLNKVGRQKDIAGQQTAIQTDLYGGHYLDARARQTFNQT